MKHREVLELNFPRGKNPFFFQLKVTKHKIKRLKMNSLVVIQYVCSVVPPLPTSNTFSSSPKKTPCPSRCCSSFFYFPQPLEATSLCSITVDLLLQGISYKWNYTIFFFLHPLTFAYCSNPRVTCLTVGTITSYFRLNSIFPYISVYIL